MSSQEMEQIIQEYGDDIYRFCFHLTGSREEADDLYQDTFVKAIQIGHRLDRGGNIKIARGQDCIQQGDTVIVLTSQKGLRDIRDILRK